VAPLTPLSELRPDPRHRAGKILPVGPAQGIDGPFGRSSRRRERSSPGPAGRSSPGPWWPPGAADG